MTNECQHGQLKRSCALCEKDERIAKLEETLRGLIRKIELFEDDGGLSKFDPAVIEAKKLVL